MASAADLQSAALGVCHSTVHAPWGTWEEWMQLRDSLLANDMDGVRKGIRKVQAWRATREGLPLGVDLTCFLVELTARDPSGTLDREARQVSDCFPESVLRLGYTMTIVRLVTGVMDSIRKAGGTTPDAGLPCALVEGRNAAVHQKLPTLQRARVLANLALGFLVENYWNVQAADVATRPGSIQQALKAITLHMSEIKAPAKRRKKRKSVDQTNDVPRRTIVWGTCGSSSDEEDASVQEQVRNGGAECMSGSQGEAVTEHPPKRARHIVDGAIKEIQRLVHVDQCKDLVDPILDDSELLNQDPAPEDAHARTIFQTLSRVIFNRYHNLPSELLKGCFSRLLSSTGSSAACTKEELCTWIKWLLQQRGGEDPLPELLNTLISLTLSRIHWLHTLTNSSGQADGHRLASILEQLLERAQLQGMTQESATKLKEVADWVEESTKHNKNRAQTRSKALVDGYIPLATDEEKTVDDVNKLIRSQEKFLEDHESGMYGIWTKSQGWSLCVSGLDSVFPERLGW
ncbi:unnamed protein product [Ostreobium quekettii]|uniref:Las1-like n=1 Tax=Ostreobium quekettii TaxID=121088 RepID=A0A8S1J215_9CHLO|nr:unnamed protein product [Ostreobium quekettii]|eukprot:evm.model.scf_765.3 EVM.evm.TU.scf_765.3   scf_765:15376-19097(-)